METANYFYQQISYLFINNDQINYSGKYDTCQNDDDCFGRFDHCTDNGICEHDSIFKNANFLVILSYILIPIIVGISNVGGIGGGIVKLPILVILLQYSIQYSTFIAYPITLGGCLTNIFLLLKQKHPNKPKPVIDFGIALMMVPGVLLGTQIGVVLNKLLDEFVLSLIFIIFLLAVSPYLIFRFISLRKLEFQIQNALSLIYRSLSKETVSHAQSLDNVNSSSNIYSSSSKKNRTNQQSLNNSQNKPNIEEFQNNDENHDESIQKKILENQEQDYLDNQQDKPLLQNQYNPASNNNNRDFINNKSVNNSQESKYVISNYEEQMAKLQIQYQKFALYLPQDKDLQKYQQKSEQKRKLTFQNSTNKQEFLLGGQRQSLFKSDQTNSQLKQTTFDNQADKDLETQQKNLQEISNTVLSSQDDSEKLEFNNQQYILQRQKSNNTQTNSQLLQSQQRQQQNLRQISQESLMKSESQIICLERQLIMDKEKLLIPIDKFILFFITLCVYTFVQLNIGKISLFGIERCGSIYWIFFGFQILFLVLVSFFSWKLVQKEILQKKLCNYDFDTQDIQDVELPFYYKINFASVFAGFIAGLVGAGAGLVMVPVLLLLKVNPTVAAATSGFMYFFISFSSILSIIVGEYLSYDVILWYTLLAFIGGASVSPFIYFIVNKYKKQSVVVLIVLTLALGNIGCNIYYIIYTSSKRGFNYLLQDGDFC